MAKKKAVEGETKVTTPAEKAEKKSKQDARREAFFSKHEKQIREHFGKEKAKVSTLQRDLKLMEQQVYLDLLWCRNKIAAEKK